MGIKDARFIFYKLKYKQINYNYEFSNVLARLFKSALIRHQEGKVLHFNKEKLDNILTVSSKAKSGQLFKCRMCTISFTTEQELRKHKKNDLQHHFRNLYLNNSKELRKGSQEIVIEINRGSGLGAELLLLNSDRRSVFYVNIKNISKDIFVLEHIIELHQHIQAFNLDKKVLPVTLGPKGELKLPLVSDIKEATTQRLVYVFLFRNKTHNSTRDVLKELTIHVNSEAYNELHSTSAYEKPTTVENDIDPKIYVDAEDPKPRHNYKVDLYTYAIPKALPKILSAGLRAYDGMSEEEYTYLCNIKKLLQTNKSGQCLTRKNYVELLDLLIHMEDVQLSIDIKSYDRNTKSVVKVKGYNDRYELRVPDLAERRPSLLPGDSVFVKSANSKTYQGVVKATKQDSVILKFSREFSNSVYAAGINLSVRYGYNRSNIRAEHRSLNLIHKHRVLAPLFPVRIQETSVKNYQLKWINDKIKTNPQQQQAVLHILSKTAYPAPYLIFGPPGTGKTMTIVEAISQVWKTKPTSNILVCAPSNSVANEIASRLTKCVPKSQMFRYMSVSFGMYDIPDDVLPFTNYDDGDFYQPTVAEVCSYKIVISTLTNASRLVSLGVPAIHFSYVFIDESGHATETETLIAIAGLITSQKAAGTVLGQIVLAGDPKQLGPIIHSSFAKQYGYGRSMLERMMDTVEIYKKNPNGEYNPMVLTKLLHNYRSHPAILKLPNKLFYDNELIPKADDLVNIALNWEMLPNKKIPIIFHSVVGLDQREANSPSYFNIQEVEIVMKYLTDLIEKRLKGRKIMQSDIGVIAPYRKQVQKLQKACEKKNWKDLTIGSVEQFQGQERLIIIISTVRSQPKLLKFDNKFHLGFLNNPKRFNVAITRAKALVIVVGNPNLLQYEVYWRKFIEYCIKNKCITGTPFTFSNREIDTLALDMAKMRIDGATVDTADFSRGNI